MADDPLISYLDVQLAASGLADNDIGNAADREVSRAMPILSRCDDYFVAISRLSVPLNSIPLTIARLDPLGTNGLDCRDKITLSYNTFTATVPVRLQLQPEEINTQYPQPDGYWFIWDRGTVAAMLTEALARATTALNIAAGSVILATPPYVSFDPTTGLNSITCTPSTLFDLSTTRTNKVMVWTNQAGALWWLGFDAVGPLAPLPVQATHMWWYLSIRSNGANSLGGRNPTGAIAPATPSGPLVFAQNYCNTCMLCLQTVQIRSNLPVCSELVDKIPGSAGSSSSAIVNVLTDIIPSSTAEPATFQTTALYVESGLGQMRWLKLNGDMPLSTFNVSLWWTDRLGVARPVLIQNEQCSLKLCFAHKSIIANYPRAYGDRDVTMFNSPYVPVRGAR